MEYIGWTKPSETVSFKSWLYWHCHTWKEHWYIRILGFEFGYKQNEIYALEDEGIAIEDSRGKADAECKEHEEMEQKEKARLEKVAKAFFGKGEDEWNKTTQAIRDYWIREAFRVLPILKQMQKERDSYNNAKAKIPIEQARKAIPVEFEEDFEDELGR